MRVAKKLLRRHLDGLYTLLDVNPRKLHHLTGWQRPTKPVLISVPSLETVEARSGAEIGGHRRICQTAARMNSTVLAPNVRFG
jgi:hypothetical protein